MDQQEYKKRFSYAEYYKALLLFYHAIRVLQENRKTSHLIDQPFIERIMLSVTEVNGCAMCSYAHSSMALKQGFSQEEIESFLTGDASYIVPHEAKALLFAQHYAYNSGYADKEAYEALIDEYGKEKSEVILSAIKVIMVGNIMGIPLSAFVSRLKGKRYKGSSLLYEISMILSSIVFIPISAIHSIFYKTRLRFSSTNA
jgi:AhpD family alkylhydroperoxidase